MMLHSNLSHALSAALAGFGASLLLNCPPAAAQWAPSATCGPINNAFGPFDYRVRRGAELKDVETHHFHAKVQALVPSPWGPVGSDLDYTLRAFPNHHPALALFEKLAKKEKTDKPRGAQWDLECYYDRAIRFAADDGVVRMLYANHLIMRNRGKDAVPQIEKALSLSRESGLTQMNAGLLYFEMKDYDKALEHAHIAFAMGVTRTDLRERLQSVNRWKEPAAVAAAPAAAAAPASAETATAAASSVVPAPR